MSREQLEVIKGFTAQRELDFEDLDTTRQLLDAADDFLAQGNPPQVATEVVVDAGGVEAVLRVPAEVRTDTVIVYFHGGGYMTGSPKSHRTLTVRLAEAAHLAILVVDYRLAPEHPFPAALDDGVAAVRWAVAPDTPKALDEAGLAVERCILAGDSAGGGLAVSAAMRIRDEGADEANEAIRGILAMSGWFDLTNSMLLAPDGDEDPLEMKKMLDYMADKYVRPDQRDNPYASPLFGDLAGLAPMLLQAGTGEVLYADTKRMAGRAADAGVEAEFEAWAGMTHVFQIWASMLDEGREAIEKAGAWVAGVA